jgi:hypothetical protein
MFRADRCNIKSYNNRGAGVVVYINEDYEVKEIESRFSYPEKVQSVQVEIRKNTFSQYSSSQYIECRIHPPNSRTRKHDPLIEQSSSRLLGT